MRPVPERIDFVFPPVAYADGRRSLCTLPPDYVQPALSTADMVDLALEFNIDEPLVRAVMEVESGGSGFLLREPPPARPRILFEAHQFYRRTPVIVSASRPDLASKTWDRSLYIGGSAEWDRLLDAMAFDPAIAPQCASFGLGQIMGFNFRAAGCESVEQFVAEAFAGEYWQARHMMKFIQSNDLLRFLTARDWAGFALRYNGAGYQQNQYDTKLAAAYQRALSRPENASPSVDLTELAGLRARADHLETELAEVRQAIIALEQRIDIEV